MKCSCLLSALITLATGALDAVFLKKSGIDFAQPTTPMLIACLAFSILAFALAVGIFFYCDQDLDRVAKFRCLGFFLMAEFLSKGVLLVYQITKGQLSVIIRYGLIGTHQLDLIFFVLGGVTQIFVIWLALLLLCRFKDIAKVAKKKKKYRPRGRVRQPQRSHTHNYTGPETRENFSIVLS